jgi:hypothetical protein
VRVVYAIIAGQDEQDFRANAALAQELYDNYFIGPEPPPAPTLTVTAGDEKVYLSWDKAAQSGLDPLSGENDFSGYKLYRSDNQGKTWGNINWQTGNNCMDFDYDPVRLYTVASPDDPIPHSYIDAGLINGVEYWYCLAAFDTGASATGVDPLQSGFGVPGSAVNIMSVKPRTDPAGFYEAAGTVVHQYSGTDQPSEGNVMPVIFDHGQLLGADYQVVFEDTPEETYWHLINVTTGDTILASQTRDQGDADLYEIAEGLRVVIRNGDRQPRSMGQTTIGGADTSLVLHELYGPAVYYFTESESNIYGDEHFRSTFELRYTGDSSLGPDVLEYWYGSPVYSIPFEAWNTTTGQRVSLAVFDVDWDGLWQTSEPLVIVNYPYDPNNDLTTLAFPTYYSWMFDFDDAVYNPSVGDVYTVEGAPLNSPADVFLFSVDGINDARAREELKNIKVVPDPYYAFATMWEVAEGESNLQFQNLPDECTIRIYTLSGGLVRTIVNSSGTGTVEWDLLTESRRLVASGIYVYHVESPYGEHIGRFAVVK